MRILHIVPTYVPAYRYGGPIKSVHNLNKWLVKNGVEVTVYTTNLNGNELLDIPLNKECFVDGVKVYYFPVTFKSWEYSFALHRALAKNVKNFDLIHITSVFLSVSTLGAFYAKKFKKPYIISPRGSLMKEPLGMKSNLKKRIYISLIEKRNLKNASAIHFTAESEKEEYVKAGLLLKKSVVLQNGLDPNEFCPEAVVKNKINFREKYGICLDKKIILSLGRINWKKGFDTLIPAFAHVLKKKPNAILVIAGEDDGYKENTQLLITNYQLQDKVVFTGMLVDEEKTAAYKESDIFVLPSYSENFGMAVAEAMYFKKPVIITPQVAISDMVEKAGAGLVVPKTTNAFAEAIVKLIQNKNLREQMGEKGRGLVMREFSPGAIGKRMLQAYNELVQKR